VIQLSRSFAESVVAQSCGQGAMTAASPAPTSEEVFQRYRRAARQPMDV
jgi:hypothetical protein